MFFPVLVSVLLHSLETVLLSIFGEGERSDPTPWCSSEPAAGVSHCLLILIGAGFASNAIGFIKRLDALPVMRRWLGSASAPVREGQIEPIGPAVSGIAGAAVLGDANKAERFGFADRRRDRTSVDPVVNKLSL
jgi:hypothetical protein